MTTTLAVLNKWNIILLKSRVKSIENMVHNSVLQTECLYSRSCSPCHTSWAWWAHCGRQSCQYYQLPVPGTIFCTLFTCAIFTLCYRDCVFISIDIYYYLCKVCYIANIKSLDVRKYKNFTIKEFSIIYILASFLFILWRQKLINQISDIRR
jgi:hypothetical protein